ncbi:MAG: hypothetical protein AB1483_10700 [Candidatus Zixiibacteriota bacterium]
MNLNPVIKFDIDCRVPAEKAKERLVEITKKQSFFTPDFGQFNATDKRRYIGRIGEKRFSLKTRPRKSLAGFFLHTNRQIVISGEIEPRGPWSLVKVVIRPTLDVIISWAIATFTILYMLWVVTTEQAQDSDWVVLVMASLFLFVYIKTYMWVSLRERKFLCELFGTGATATLDQTPAQVTSSWSSRGLR